jgi:hypothetical protein
MRLIFKCLSSPWTAASGTRSSIAITVAITVNAAASTPPLRILDQ